MVSVEGREGLLNKKFVKIKLVCKNPNLSLLLGSEGGEIGLVKGCQVPPWMSTGTNRLRENVSGSCRRYRRPFSNCW
jgi:hypothetical protein